MHMVHIQANILICAKCFIQAKQKFNIGYFVGFLYQLDIWLHGFYHYHVMTMSMHTPVYVYHFVNSCVVRYTKNIT